MKQRSILEKSPEDGKTVRWEGPSLSEVVEKSLAALPLESRAQVDLVILKAGSRHTLIPRWYVNKSGMIAALKKNGAPGTLASVTEWSGSLKPNLGFEDLPLRSYLLEGVTEMELTRYQERFPRFFLKRRTDPAAMRGERIFTQNCMGCHAAGHGPDAGAVMHTAGAPAAAQAQSRDLASGHGARLGVPKLTARDGRALTSYLDAFKRESTPATASAP